jgi:4-amino-4-deoxy-L-arabinose transferase-like glycosyltransferase
VTKFYRIWFIALTIKIALAIWLPFSNDEAYYWFWGHLPSLSYFDHPPMVGWLFWLGRAFDFIGNGSRLPGVLLGHTTLLIWHRLLLPYLDQVRLQYWITFILFSPFLGLGSLIITPDVPLVFFWSLSILVLHRALQTKSYKWYLGLGASLGLGFCSKYLVVLFVPISLLWLTSTGRWRQVCWRFVPLTLLTGLLFCGPVIFWNWRHEWASFAFQLNHGLSSTKHDLTWPLQYSIAQILLIFPTTIWLATRRNEPKDARWLHFFGWIPVLFFLYTSFRARVEANWPIMAHPALLSLAILNAKNYKLVKATVILWAAALVFVLSLFVSPWLPIDPRRLKINESHRFDAFLPWLQSEVQSSATTDESSEAQPEIFFGSYQMAATLSYKTRHLYFKLAGMNRRDHFDYLSESRPHRDRFWLGTESTDSLPPDLVREGFQIVSTRELKDGFQIHEVKRIAQDSHH